MSNAEPAILSECERLLILATFLQKTRPKEKWGANCAKILHQALVWAGLWNERLEHEMHQMGYSDAKDIEIDGTVSDWYQTLISMTRRNPHSAFRITH
ncbi:MAG: hypothetical protein ABSH20_01865 [Tepidisphaeraceae bacterium]|jgi:hypothetical protein